MAKKQVTHFIKLQIPAGAANPCLLYTSDAADEL